jgi:hypothetical protein
MARGYRSKSFLPDRLSPFQKEGGFILRHSPSRGEVSLPAPYQHGSGPAPYQHGSGPAPPSVGTGAGRQGWG